MTPTAEPAPGNLGQVAEDIPFDFAATVVRFETPLLRYVRQFAESPDEAEDIVQETFLRLHSAVEKNGPESLQSVSCWLFRVAHNLALDAARRQAAEARAQEQVLREPSAAVSDEDGSLSGLGEMIRQEACERAMRELKNLPEDHRHVLLLKVIQGLTYREIGEITGLTLGNVHYRVNQALRGLARRMKEAGYM